MVHMAQEDYLGGGEPLLVGEGLEGLEIATAPGQLAGEEEADVGGDESPPVAQEPDQVLLALVRSQPAYEEQVGGAILEQPAQHGVRGLAVAAEIEVDGQHSGSPEPERLELPAVELAVRQAQVHVPGQGL